MKFTIPSMLKPKPVKLKMDKASKLQRGFTKINLFIFRGIKLNLIPKRSKVNKSFLDLKPNHFPYKKSNKKFFTCGDVGYRPSVKNLTKQVPIPYTRGY